MTDRLICASTFGGLAGLVTSLTLCMQSSNFAHASTAQNVAVVLTSAGLFLGVNVMKDKIPQAAFEPANMAIAVLPCFVYTAAEWYRTKDDHRVGAVGGKGHALSLLPVFLLPVAVYLATSNTRMHGAVCSGIDRLRGKPARTSYKFGDFGSYKSKIGDFKSKIGDYKPLSLSSASSSAGTYKPSKAVADILERARKRTEGLVTSGAKKLGDSLDGAKKGAADYLKSSFAVPARPAAKINSHPFLKDIKSDYNVYSDPLENETTLMLKTIVIPGKNSSLNAASSRMPMPSMDLYSRKPGYIGNFSS